MVARSDSQNAKQQIHDDAKGQFAKLNRADFARAPTREK